MKSFKQFIVEEQPLLLHLVNKLMSEGHRITLSAHSKTVMAGRANDLKPHRDRMSGFIVRIVDDWDCLITHDEDFHPSQDHRTNHSALFTFEQPVDEHYTLVKKKDGWWFEDAE